MLQLEIGHDMAALCADKAERTSDFSTEAARQFVLGWLRANGATRGETLTLEAKAAGHVPPDDRAFGAVFGVLSARKQIRQVGHCDRARGHGTAGGRIWALVEG
jgi:hypothetical protein